LDVFSNRAIKADFKKKNPAFKKENLRWFTGRDSITRAHNQVNQKINILSFTLAAEAAAFLGLLKKDQGPRAQQLGPVVDSAPAVMPVTITVMFLQLQVSTSFLMHPAIGPPVKMPAVFLGVHAMTHTGVSRHLPIPGAGVYDPTMPEYLISVNPMVDDPTMPEYLTMISVNSKP
jgi:hypothetical protein